MQDVSGELDRIDSGSGFWRDGKRTKVMKRFSFYWLRIYQQRGNRNSAAQGHEE